MPLLCYSIPNQHVKIGYSVYNNKYLFFFHNQKCGGTTIEKLFNLPQSHHHGTPANCYPHLKRTKNYNPNDSILLSSIRHPLDRWVSSYYFHTLNKDNFFYKMYGEKGLKCSPEYYFELLLDKENILLPQFPYCQWIKDHPIPLYVIRYEKFSEDLKRFCHLLKFPFKNLHENKTINRMSYQEFFQDKPDLKNKLINYYQKDFDLLGYKP